MAHPEAKKLGINNGLLLGAISVAIVVIQYATGTYSVARGEGGAMSIVMSILSFIIGVTIVVLAVKKLRNLQQGFISLGEGFKLGFTIYVISSLIISAWILLYCLVLEPGYQEQILDQTANQMLERNPDMGDEQIDMALSMTEKFTSPLAMVLFTILAGAFFGAIISVIVAAIMQKKKPEYLADTTDSEM